jgi:hypothetical protein
MVGRCGVPNVAALVVIPGMLMTEMRGGRGAPCGHLCRLLRVIYSFQYVAVTWIFSCALHSTGLRYPHLPVTCREGVF